MQNRIGPEPLRQQLQSFLPLLGAWQRRRAMRVLEAQRNDPRYIPLLLEATSSPDPEVARRAKTALESLSAPPARDALCALAIQNPSHPAGQIAVAQGYRPSDPEQDCLFLFLTGQLDLYFRDNEYGQDDFQTLRLAYDQSKPAIRERVMEIVRSGDIRCQPFAVRPRRSSSLAEYSEAEIQLAIQSCLRHQDWARLWRLCQELPMKYALPLLDEFRHSGWEPTDPESQRLYGQMLADSDNQFLRSAGAPGASNCILERWLAEGRQGEWANASESELLRRLVTALPPDGVQIVAVLAQKASLTPATREAVAKNQHWLVRLAGLVTGVTHMTNIEPDSNYWVNELTNAAGVFELWPSKATPADVQPLLAAPPGAFAGKLGAVRKVLRAVLAKHVTDVELVPVTFVADNDAAEIVLAD